jgi:hypothetical protein
MITIGYFHGANKEIQDKIGFKHGEKKYNTQINNIIDKILKAKLNIMVTQQFNDKPPYKNYIVWIDTKDFKRRIY